MNEGEHKPAGHWHYKSEDGGGPGHTASGYSAPDKTIEWTASEFIAHHKGFGWYALLFLGTVLVTALIFWITRDRIAAGAIVVCALIFAVAGAHKPRVLTYRLDSSGLTIGPKFYPYNNYKAFAVIDEGPFSSISFLPLKRFMPGLSIYFAPEDEAHIIEVLSSYLPLQPGSTSAFDDLMRRIRF
jgi:hypothetical protein